MAITYETAIDAILGTLKTKWDSDTTAIAGSVPPLVFEADEPSLKVHPKDTTEPWARAVLRHADAFKATLASDTGTARYRRVGILWVQVFTPVGKAENWTLAQRLAAVVQSAFEGQRAGSGDVVFTKSVILDAPRESSWWRYDVRTDFYWDEIR